MGIILQNVSLLRTDPYPWNVLIEKGVIRAVSQEPLAGGEAVVDGAGRLLVPGFVDLHTHLREPGFEDKETIASGTLAAAKGGYIKICAMPNTDPVPDSPKRVKEILKLLQDRASIPVEVVAAATVSRAGRVASPAGALRAAGAIALSDDGSGIQDLTVLTEVLKQCKGASLPYFSHCEDRELAAGGIFQDTFPGEAEVKALKRELEAVRKTGARYHLCHISTAESVELVAAAKAEGLKVTAEVTPHHLLLSTEMVSEWGPLYKVNPPLRPEADRIALIQGLKEGIIDCIATDHAPHTAAEKALPIEEAPFGISGIELSFPMLYSGLVLTGEISLRRVLDALITKPRKILGNPQPRLELAEGDPADLTLLDLALIQEVRAETMVSRGKNTPFLGQKLQGWPVLTLVSGRIVWQAEVLS
ncbi:MAG: dihydroorotase [Firmicutes bacterium]|nr:dihydroorotase [Bacillota bacterium]